ncbi:MULTISPECIES: TetR/AcrR family transcriptional regulator [unclassified Pseudomonas]|uniref:TetR/AcrR family transcriptional regulator n=1 Tax=unclassified Pseudomonas TaxID=196821 RepID=UPI000D3870D2|nr:MULTISPECIES: TetR/AcrR family transcriptional regulator [unclassified Pseudomonas]RAU48031.1 TetR/AcrR family transcriptional regulator [Pseudomonas sp. RIT 409]RAU55274.1 TetR/AcrR family transcriptional regulator [Pseudomonas sp. RIT 412]
MKVTKERRELNKEKILTAASRLYREHGIEGIGIGELSKSVGLTHGGFYRQFPQGKDQLVAEAIQRTFDEYCEFWSTLTSASEVVHSYVNHEHCQSKHDACPIPTLAADVARVGGAPREAYTRGVKRMVELLMAKKGDLVEGTSEKQAMQMLASAAGAMIIARASSCPELAEKFMAAVLEQWDAPSPAPEVIRD